MNVPVNRNNAVQKIICKRSVPKGGNPLTTSILTKNRSRRIDKSKLA